MSEKSLYRFRFNTVQSRIDFEETEKKLLGVCAKLDATPIEDYSARNIIRRKRNKLLYDIFSIVHKQKNASIKRGTEIRKHMSRLCKMCNTTFKDMNILFEEEFEQINIKIIK